MLCHVDILCKEQEQCYSLVVDIKGQSLLVDTKGGNIMLKVKGLSL